MKTGFVNQLDCSPLPDGKLWRLNADLIWVWPDGSAEVCRAGMLTDFASVPDLGRLAGWFMALAMLLRTRFPLTGWSLFWCAWLIGVFAKRIDDDDRTDAPACFHDQDYFRRDKSRAAADWHLVVRMRAMQVGWWKCFLYWFNLRLFGWVAWNFGDHLKKS